MSRWVFTITVDVDDEALAEGADKDRPPYGLPPDEWTASDLVAAAGDLIVDLDEAEIDAYEDPS